MKKSLVVSMAIAAMVCSSAVFAAPKALSSGALDTVTAGAGIMDWFLGTTQTTNQTVATNEVDTTTAVGVGAGNGAATNGGEAFAGAVADQDAIALNGAGNVGVDIDVAIPVTDSFNTNAAIGTGAVAVMGEGNEIWVDNSTVCGTIAAGAAGVIAREATVTNSFNTQITTIDLDVNIDDSFNVYNNSLDISGQNYLTAIINANSVGDQMVGANLNVTSATASVPSIESGIGGVIPIVSGNAIAITIIDQTVINSSIVLDATLQ